MSRTRSAVQAAGWPAALLSIATLGLQTWDKQVQLASEARKLADERSALEMCHADADKMRAAFPSIAQRHAAEQSDLLNRLERCHERC